MSTPVLFLSIDDPAAVLAVPDTGLEWLLVSWFYAVSALCSQLIDVDGRLTVGVVNHGSHRIKSDD